jgi:hypothetical protein
VPSYHTETLSSFQKKKKKKKEVIKNAVTNIYGELQQHADEQEAQHRLSDARVPKHDKIIAYCVILITHT